MNKINSTILNDEYKENNLITFVILLFINFIPIVFESLIRLNMRDIANAIIIFTVWVIFVYVTIYILKEKKINLLMLFLLMLFFCAMLYITLSNSKISISYLYIIYAAGLYYFISTLKDKVNILLKVSNIVYLIFLGLSLLVYFSLIQWPNTNLNLFQYNVFGFTYTTFIGFYGSTAHIDSYSLLIFFVNLFFNKGKGRYFFILVPLLAAIATVRFTPFVSIFVALFFLFMFSKFGKRITPIISLSIFSSFYIVYLIMLYFNNFTLNEMMGNFTNGRNFIWYDMLTLYNNYDDMTLNKLIGFGNTELFSVSSFGNTVGDISNPHNSYLRILIENGFIFYSLIYLFMTYKLTLIKNKIPLFLSFFILMVGVTNNEVFSFSNPIFLLWFLVLISENVETDNANHQVQR